MESELPNNFCLLGAPELRPVIVGADLTHDSSRAPKEHITATQDK